MPSYRVVGPGGEGGNLLSSRGGDLIQSGRVPSGQFTADQMHAYARAALAQAPAAEPVSRLVQQARELCAATLRAGPGVAVEIPADLAAEGRKFMRGEPSLIEQMPFAEVQKLGDILNGA